MKHIPILLCSIILAAHGAVQEEPLTLERALEIARINSPELKAARLQTLAAGQAVKASGRWKNPELAFEAEGIGGDLDGFNDTEYTLALSQTFERGGKRKHDRVIAEKSIAVAFQAEAEKELALLADVRSAFIEVVALQEVADIRVEQEKLALDFVNVAKKRFQAGGASELELLEAELSQAETQMEGVGNSGKLKTARIRLASLIGIPESDMEALTADYYELPTIGTGDVLDTHPILGRLEAEVEVKRAEAALARAADAADITLGAGVRYEATADLNSFVFGASMPLNFVRSGKVAEAATLMQADALMAEGEELRRKLEQELAILLAAYAGARQEAEITRDQLIPRAERAYELSKAGYDAGRYSWIELIATQQHLTEIRIRHIAALKDAHLAAADITRFMNEEI